MKILLASASATARKIIRGILEKAGIAAENVSEITDRKAIFAAFKEAAGAPGLAIVDWDLPDLDGPAFARYLRASAPRTGLLLCVKSADREAVSGIPAPAAFDWIERPFTDGLFRKKFEALRDTVGKARTTDGARSLRALTSTKQTEFSLPFLLQLPSNLIDDLLKHSPRRRHARGTVLLRAGEIPEALHIVTQGEVEILEGSAGIGTRIVGEGDPFGELSFMTAQPSPETVRAHTEVEVVSVSKAELADTLRRHPRMADYLSSLLSRHSKTMKARATTLSHADFKGTLDATPFADLIQLLGSTRKTGVLGFRLESRAGAIYLEQGEAVHAWTDDLKGEEAFFEISSWRNARFAFRSIRRQEPRTLQVPTMTLLLEAMRRLEK